MGFFSGSKNCPTCGTKTAADHNDDGASRQKCPDCGKKGCYVCMTQPKGHFHCPKCGNSSGFDRW